MYQVIDNRTGQLVGTYSTAKRARRKADKLDLVYGAIRYSVRFVDTMNLLFAENN